FVFFFFFSSRRRHTRFSRDWSSDVCSSDLRWRRACCIGLRVRTSRWTRRMSGSWPIRSGSSSRGLWLPPFSDSPTQSSLGVLVSQLARASLQLSASDHAYPHCLSGGSVCPSLGPGQFLIDASGRFGQRCCGRPW